MEINDTKTRRSSTSLTALTPPSLINIGKPPQLRDAQEKPAEQFSSSCSPSKLRSERGYIHKVISNDVLLTCGEYVRIRVPSFTNLKKGVPGLEGGTSRDGSHQIDVDAFINPEKQTRFPREFGHAVGADHLYLVQVPVNTGTPYSFSVY